MLSNEARGKSKVPVPNNQTLIALANYLDAHLGAEDAMVLTLIPCSDKETIKARAAIAAPDLKSPWVHDANTYRFWPLPSAIGVILGVFILISIGRVFEEYSAFDPRILDPVSSVSVWAAILVVATSMFGLLYEFKPTRRVGHLVKHLHFPPGLVLRAFGRVVSNKHIAGWTKRL